MSETTAVRALVENNRRILIVDDNRAIHEDFRKILAGNARMDSALGALEAEIFGAAVDEPREVFELTSAYQGEEAIEKVRAARAVGTPYSVVFVDVRMPPGMDGIATTARLLDLDPEVSVVVCSAYSDHTWEEMTAAFGKTDRVLILKKPFDTVEVRQIAHALQRRWHLARTATLKVDDLSAVVREQTRELKAANAALKREAAAREDALARLNETAEQVRALAYQDGLTGLPNRRLLHDHLERVLGRARRKNLEFAVLFIDLDNFKLINDTIGHHAADEVLRIFARTLTGLIRSEDVVCLHLREDIDHDNTITVPPITGSILSRLGGDEFIVILPELRDRYSAGAVAQRILSQLEQPIRAEGQEVYVTASIGIATYPDDGSSGELLVRNADTAMYHAKQQGKAAYQYYSSEMNAASVERLTLETGLRRALETGGLELHFQPQLGLRTGEIIGAEALLRWKHPQRGYVPPSTFVPIAENSGLLLPIGEWVLRESCRQAVAWQRADLPPVGVSVNVSGLQVQRQNVPEIVKSALSETGLDPRHLWIEITETVLMSGRDRAVDVLKELRGLGVRIALDDFGTGYSSLSYLRTFPIDMLKLDRSFVSSIVTDRKTATIVEAIISMTRVLGLDVLAEGVESHDQLALLQELGCHSVQGYFVSAALPPGELLHRLAKGRTSLPASKGLRVGAA